MTIGLLAVLGCISLAALLFHRTRGEHRFAADQGFKINDAESLAFARHREHVTKIVVIRQLFLRNTACQKMASAEP